MSAENKIKFTTEEQQDIVRKLQYIDFRNSRYDHHTALPDNVVATTRAALTLSGYNYNEEQLHSMITSTHSTLPDAARVRRYHSAVSYILSLQHNDSMVDEMFIMSLYSLITGNDSDTLHPGQDRPWIYNNTTVHSPMLHGRGVYVTPQLSDLVEWYLIQSQLHELHPLIITAIFLYELVDRESFETDKEEMMHLIELALLRRYKAHWIGIYSPCRTMTADLLSYSRALRGRENIGNSITHWIIYWIDHVYEAACHCAKLEFKPTPVVLPMRKSVINERQLKILNYITHNNPVKLADIVAHMHKVSVNTIKKDLLLLRELDYIAPWGVLKGTVYFRI